MDVDPHFGNRWRSAFSFKTERVCIPRCATLAWSACDDACTRCPSRTSLHTLQACRAAHHVRRPTCRVDTFVFHEVRESTRYLDQTTIETAALYIMQKLAQSRLGICQEFAQNALQPAVSQSCFRKADRDMSGQVTEREMSAWFACVDVPFVCQSLLCA